MASYQMSFDDDLKIVHVTVRGDLTEPIGEEIITKARTLAAEHAAGLLYDVRQATLRVAFSRWFFLPRELEVLKKKATRSARVAIVVRVEELDEYRFYETVSANVGLIVRIFQDYEEAVGWLSSTGTPDPENSEK